MKRVLLQIILIISIISLMITNVKAASFELVPTADKQTANPGDEILVTLSVSNIDLGEDGINTVEGKLEYNKDIFEEITGADITSLNNWTTTYNDQDTDRNGKFLSMILSGGVKEEQSICTIKLKVKEGASVGPTQIKITEIVANDGINLIEDDDKTILIMIGDPSAQDKDDDDSNRTKCR